MHSTLSVYAIWLGRIKSDYDDTLAKPHFTLIFQDTFLSGTGVEHCPTERNRHAAPLQSSTLRGEIATTRIATEADTSVCNGIDSIQPLA